MKFITKRNKLPLICKQCCHHENINYQEVVDYCLVCQDFIDAKNRPENVEEEWDFIYTNN